MGNYYNPRPVAESHPDAIKKPQPRDDRIKAAFNKAFDQVLLSKVNDQAAVKNLQPHQNKLRNAMLEYFQDELDGCFEDNSDAIVMEEFVKARLDLQIKALALKKAYETGKKRRTAAKK